MIVYWKWGALNPVLGKPREVNVRFYLLNQHYLHHKGREM
jgi:hypothetical protein